MEREQLIPVLCTMLKLSNEEKQFMSEYAKGLEIEYCFGEKILKFFFSGLKRIRFLYSIFNR